jgi:hypothetical protein
MKKNKEIINLVRYHCANLHRENCIFGGRCKILEDEECKYFDEYVFPLLDIFAQQKAKKKAREHHE